MADNAEKKNISKLDFNIQDALKEEHTKGYMEGYNDKN